MTKSYYCFYCNSYIKRKRKHVLSYKHETSVSEFKNVLQSDTLPLILKIYIISYLYPSVNSVYTLYQCIHCYYQRSCNYEILYRSNYIRRCKHCLRNNNINSPLYTYDSFMKEAYYPLPLCMNCLYRLVTCTNFIDTNHWYVYNESVYYSIIPNNYGNNLLRFIDIFEKLQKYYSRHNICEHMYIDLEKIMYFDTLENYFAFLRKAYYSKVQQIDDAILL